MKVRVSVRTNHKDLSQEVLSLVADRIWGCVRAIKVRVCVCMCVYVCV